MSSIRTRLFSKVTDSPTSGALDETEIEALLTPDGKVDDSVDSGIAAGLDFSIKIPNRKCSKRKLSADSRRSLFSGNRLVEEDDVTESPMTKRLRETVTEFKACSIKDTQQSSSIIDAVDRLATERDLVADGSRDYCLPTIPGKHSDLKSISCETMVDVLSGKYDNQMEKVTIVDCRYPYEFEGGHIKGAVNMYTKDTVQSLLQTPVTSEKKHVLIFHCEFSSERGPKMYRFLRSQDRDLNKGNYPALNFPEVYLLDGGYKAFFNTQKDLCEPISYTPMLHEEHAADLRHFRVKSKSWTAGEKQETSRRCRSRLSCQGLAF